MKDGVSECVYWMMEWVNGFINEWMMEWWNDGMSEWIYEWWSEWMDLWMMEWGNGIISEWKMEWVNGFINEWMMEQVNVTMMRDIVYSNQQTHLTTFPPFCQELLLPFRDIILRLGSWHSFLSRRWGPCSSRFLSCKEVPFPFW